MKECGDPELNMNTGMMILGHRSASIINDLQDQDVESEYPTVITTCNIDAKTQIGRVIANKDNMTKREIYDDYEKYDRGGKFLDDMQIREPMLFMYRWHNLPGASEVIEGFKEFNPSASKKKLFKPAKQKRKLFKNR